MVDSEQLRRRILDVMPDAQVAVRDLTGGGDHYEVEVISQMFDGMPELKRHRMVYAPLRDILGGALHALALSTKTPTEAAS